MGEIAVQPKLALLFLTRGDVLHPQIWREFYDDAVKDTGGTLPVFLHAKEPHAVGEWLASVASPVPTIPTAWGNISLVRATLALLKAGLEQSDATHFALLSESCVPIKSWAAIRSRLVLDDRSRIGWESYAEMKPAHRHRSEAVKGGAAGMWHFQHQWMVLRRDLAQCAVAEDHTIDWEGCFAPDEHYFITRFWQMGLDVERLVRKECSTWVEWKRGRLTHWAEVSGEMALEWMNSQAFFMRKALVHSDIGKWQLHRSVSAPVLVCDERMALRWNEEQEVATGSLRVHVLCQPGKEKMRQVIRETWGSMLEREESLVFHLAAGEYPVKLDERMHAAGKAEHAEMWARCEEVLRDQRSSEGMDWCFVCTDETYLHVPRLLANRVGGWECLLPAEDWQDNVALQGGILVRRDLLDRLRMQGGEGFQLRADMLVQGVTLRVEQRMGGVGRPVPRRSNDAITRPCDNEELMRAVHCSCVRVPLFSVSVLHANWKDELEFFPGGFFSRKHGACMGRYEANDAGVVLDWHHWGREYVAGLDLNSAEVEHRDYVIRQFSGDACGFPAYDGRALYVSPVGGDHALLESTIQCMRQAGVDVLLIHYDDSELPAHVAKMIDSGVVRCVRDRGGKWQLALRHVSPASVSAYDHVMIWDDDMDVREFCPRVYLGLVASHGCAMSQPGIVSRFSLSHSITRARQCKMREGGGNKVGRLTNFVEIMVPCFSKEGWATFYEYLSEENVSGYGYDYIDCGKRGIIDLMPVIHTRAVSSKRKESLAERDRFFERSGLCEFDVKDIKGLEVI